MSFSIDGISSLVSNAQNSAAAGSASALKNSISSVSSGSSEEELLSVCKDFESYFVEEVLKEVKENLISDDDEDNGCFSQYADRSSHGTARSNWWQMRLWIRWEKIIRSSFMSR